QYVGHFRLVALAAAVALANLFEPRESDADRDQLLGGGIVQLARNAAALLALRLQQAAGDAPEVLEQVTVVGHIDGRTDDADDGARSVAAEYRVAATEPGVVAVGAAHAIFDGAHRL